MTFFERQQGAKAKKQIPPYPIKQLIDWHLIVVVVVGLCVRIGALLLVERISALAMLLDFEDAIVYKRLAWSLLRNGDFRLEGNITAFRMPGYPIFLAILFAIWDSELAIQLAQIVFDTITICAVYAVACELVLPVKMRQLATLLVAINPLLVFTAFTLIPETLVTTLFAIAAWMIVRYMVASQSLARKRGLVTVIYATFTIGIYLKPTTLVVGLLAAFALLASRIQKQGLSHAVLDLGLATIIIVVALTPWVVRNGLTMGTFIPLTTTSGTNLYGGNNPQADGGYSSNLPYVLPDMSEAESSATLSRKALEWILSNPWRFLTLLPRKAVRHWSPTALGTKGVIPLPRFLIFLAVTGYVVFYIMVLLGVLALVQERKHLEVVALMLIPFSLFALSLVYFGATRFALPSFPQLAVLSVIGFDWLRKKVS